MGLSGEEKGCNENTDCYDFSANVGEGSLCDDTTGAKEVALCTSEPIVVREWTRVLPVTEPDAIVVWTTT